MLKAVIIDDEPDCVKLLALQLKMYCPQVQVLAECTSSEAGLPYSITYPDKKQFAPRIGFAWRPFGESTVLRGGYGIFYEGEYTDGRVNLFMPPFLLSDTAVNGQAFQATAGALSPTPRLGEGSASQGFPDGTNARRAQVGARFIF